MKSMNEVTINATCAINCAIDKVAEHIHKVLRNANIPENIVMKYSASYCHGGEWILDDDCNLLQQDIHLMSNKELIEIVKELEGLE